jgi:hypothetical protein
MIMLKNPEPKEVPPESTVVTRSWEEYDPAAWMYLIQSITKEFGKTGPRWHWIMNGELSVGNAWSVDFHFANPHDATLFQLKY